MQSYVSRKLRKDHDEVLARVAAVSGRTYQSLLDEAIEQFLGANAETIIEEVTDKTASA